MKYDPVFTRANLHGILLLKSVHTYSPLIFLENGLRTFYVSNKFEMPVNAMSELTDSGLAWLATTIPLLFMAMLAVAFRVAWQRGRLNKADVGILIALSCIIAHEIVGCVGIFIWGLGHDVISLRPEKAQKAIMCLYILQVIYQTTIATIQISLLFFYISLLPTPGLKPIYHITTLSIFISMIAFGTATIFQCTPIPYVWDRTIENGHCINRSALSITHAITNIFFYLLLFILSLPILRSLHLSRSQKYAISCMYLLGCAVLTTSILNLSSLIPISSTPQIIRNPQTLLTHSLESLLSLILLSILTSHTPLSKILTSLPHLKTPSPPPPTTTISLTRFPANSRWKTLKSRSSSFKSRSSIKSLSSKYSHHLHPAISDMDMDTSVCDEMMIYVTVLEDRGVVSGGDRDGGGV
ncbi:hypothetical protein OCU04_006170 [Sclerotinia nivalis]|uniref:Rhodopsin domain-containing protein n=1 Tax=Sclerotinia nivalis TaxID=352851 RepID=A0A9X0AMG1_9HELO|nr:hypothetical protein OCU04_006170 [Sclerotinia nivalis]